MSAPTMDCETTGHLEAVWRPSGAEVVQAPAKVAIDASVLDDLDRDPTDDDVVVLPGFVRYRIGLPHPHRLFSVYLHRLDAGGVS